MTNLRITWNWLTWCKIGHASGSAYKIVSIMRKYGGAVEYPERDFVEHVLAIGPINIAWRSYP